MHIEEFLSRAKPDLENSNDREAIAYIIEGRAKELNLFGSALQCFGTELQLRKLQEECGELISAINRHLLDSTEDRFKNLVEEIADTQILLDQIKLTIPPKIYRDTYNKKLSKLMNILFEKGFPK